ncbi:hypothetical protein [Brevundimonas subvibrioides]|nr:hypothetical protein [Brevundimonas subvibrioides]
MPSDAIVAAAVTAACRLRGVDASKVNDRGLDGRRARQLAGAALHARFGTANLALAERLTLHGPELAPSMLAKAGITTDDMLSVVEALDGVDATVEVRPMSPPAPVRAITGGLNPAAPPPFVPRERKAPKASAPRPVGLPDNLSCARSRPHPTPDRAARPLPAPRPPSAQPKPMKPAHVVRLKPVTTDIARWARWFLASPIWTAEEVADLFGVHPDGLIDAVAA